MRVLTVFAVLAAALLSVGLLPGTAGTSEAALFVDDPVYDFGLAGPGDVIESLFVLENRGSEPLSVTNIASPCGCVETDLDKKRIAPGEKSLLRLLVAAGDKPGKVVKRVHVYAGESETPVIELRFTGEVVNGIRVVPQGLRFDNVPAGSPETRTARLVQFGKTPLALHRVEADPRLFEVKAQPIEYRGHAGLDVSVRLKKTAPVGPLMDAVTVRLYDMSRPNVDIPVWGRVAPPKNPNPSEK